MMWQWLVSCLASKCTIVLYDGSPFILLLRCCLNLLIANKSVFGTSAKYLDAVRKSGFIPKEKYKFAKMDIIGSTGSPLVPESFEFVYENIKKMFVYHLYLEEPILFLFCVRQSYWKSF